VTVNSRKVSLQSAVRGEVLVALVAPERPLLRVRPDVDLQHVGSTESFLAEVTGKRLLAAMREHVGGQAAALGELSIAQSALVRADPGVPAFVVAERGSVGELLVAQPALVRLLSGMGALVHAQRGGPVEPHFAHVAAEPRIARTVSPKVLSEAGRLGKVLLAHEAGIRFDALVRTHVDSQVVGFGKLPVADGTGMGAETGVAALVTVQGSGMSEFPLAQVAPAVS